MTKSSPKRKFKKYRAKISAAIAKHLGPDLTNKLKATDAYSFADPTMDLDISNGDIRKISEVSLQFLPKLTGIRAFWDSIPTMPINDNLKEDFKDKLEAYIDQMQETPAFEFLVEYHMGNVHELDVGNMLLMLEKMAGYNAEDHEDEETEAGTTDKA